MSLLSYSIHGLSYCDLWQHFVVRFLGMNRMEFGYLGNPGCLDDLHLAELVGFDWRTRVYGCSLCDIVY
jgi:hypothetical protein